MSTIKRAALPKDDRGNDPNDFRDEAGFVEKLIPAKAKPSLLWADRFKVSEKEAQEMSDPDFVFDNVVIQGHVVLIVSEPNGGKTTIMMWIAGEIAPDYRVIYVNSDVSGCDAKRMIQEAAEKGFDLLLPDMKAGLSMNDVVAHLEEMNGQDADLSGIVFIFDTLKKMTDVINKTRARELLRTLRGLSAKGATVVLLAHTNKYKGDDGQPIYEGTGDLRSDCDELIYLIPTKNPDGGMTVSTLPDKVRGTFQPITFHIDPDRNVSLASEYVDVSAIKQVELQREKDETAIQAITEAIQGGKIKQTEITQHCKDYGLGWRSVERVLNRYRRPPLKLWHREKAFEKNAWLYHLEAPNE
jgi:archaellum biogenesis ATPase FlaH